jgi:tetratricopeptide (TPR) repeat protein
MHIASDHLHAMRTRYHIGLALCALAPKDAALFLKAQNFLDRAIADCHALALEDKNLAKKMNTRVMYVSALLELSQEDYGRAFASFSQVIELATGLAEFTEFLIPVRDHLAFCLLKLQSKPQALEIFQKVYRAYLWLPDSAQVIDADYGCKDFGMHLERFGMACLEADKPQDAEHYLTQALPFKQAIVILQKERSAEALITLAEMRATMHMKKSERKQVFTQVRRDLWQAKALVGNDTGKSNAPPLTTTITEILKNLPMVRTQSGESGASDATTPATSPTHSR